MTVLDNVRIVSGANALEKWRRGESRRIQSVERTGGGYACGYCMGGGRAFEGASAGVEGMGLDG